MNTYVTQTCTPLPLRNRLHNEQNIYVVGVELPGEKISEACIGRIEKDNNVGLTSQVPQPQTIKPEFPKSHIPKKVL
jgi:hypothetical protein